MDTKYLMYHYLGKPMKKKIALADCIEAVLGKPTITSTGETPINKPVIYEMPEPKLSMVAESPSTYGAE